ARLHAGAGLRGVGVRDRPYASAGLAGVGVTDQAVVAGDQGAAGRVALGQVVRVVDVLEVVGLDEDAGADGGRDPVVAVVEVVVVDVDRVAVAHPRVALVGLVEPVVVVGDEQPAGVLRRVGVVAAQQHVLVGADGVVPGHGHVRRAALDVEAAVGARTPGVVV